MQVNENIINNLCNDAGKSRTERAIKYNNENRIDITNIDYEDENNFDISAIVYGTKQYKTRVLVYNGEIEDLDCNCPDHLENYAVCKHTLATLINFAEKYPIDKNQDEEEFIVNRKTNNKYSSFNQIVNLLYNKELDNIQVNDGKEIKGKIKLEPKLIYDRFSKELKLEFKIGENRLYKIKNLSQFYEIMENKEFFKYGDKLSFKHSIEAFREEDKKLLEFLMRNAEIIKYANSNSNNSYSYYGKALNESYIILGSSGIDELFEILKNKIIDFRQDANDEKLEFVCENPNIEFDLKRINQKEYSIIPNIDIFKTIIIKGKEYKYVLSENKIYRCTKQFEETNLMLLEIFKQNYLMQVTFGKEELAKLFSIIIPKVDNAIHIDEELEKEVKIYQPEKLEIKVFLDFDEENRLTSEIKFCYGNIEINPLNQEQKGPVCQRNIIEETKAFNIFRTSGFMYDVNNKRLILPDDEKIYKFLTSDINYYMENFEVLATERFKSREVSKPKVGTIGLKVENNLLSIDLSNLNIDLDEIQEIMEKYRLKKKFYRLKNGSFLELQESKDIEFIDKLIDGSDIDYKQLKDGNIRLPVNRTLYLNQLLENLKGTDIIKNEEYRKITNNLNKNFIEDLEDIPYQLEKVLRPYQKIGFKWLKTLDNYKFGGILADDMGLGKTIQVLAIILNYAKNENSRKASIVVSPSSLSLNWKNEAEKFAPDLKIAVIRGTANERKQIINSIDKYDLVITSYDLLKRDIEIYRQNNYQFKYIIADEAQYLKNSTTQNAKTIKQINADTRFALTGTPIENSLAELWSIFDFIMPGYLFSYKKFKTEYETAIIKENDENKMNKLKLLIEPFVLRRTKKEVLTELPEKIITVMNNEMNEEQQKIYMSYLLQAKSEILDQIDINGFEKSRIQILAALTRLRQICCHPGLFIKDYKNTSSKLEQCMQIIEDGVSSEHKILLFSSYTSMFELIQKELEKRNIKYFKLTGSTKVDDRIELVDEFNKNKEIKVFLISLKAGGTGLNLTGADMVIHYDPWWNISAENQATDRAYRIGQKNNVQVYKLITKDTIEEKIYELQKKKEKLTDDILSTKTTFINKLSKDDIMNLFN